MHNPVLIKKIITYINMPHKLMDSSEILVWQSTQVATWENHFIGYSRNSARLRLYWTRKLWGAHPTDASWQFQGQSLCVDASTRN